MHAPSSSVLFPLNVEMKLFRPRAATFSFIWMGNKWNSCALSAGSEETDWVTESGNAFMRTSKDGLRRQFIFFPKAE